MSHRYYAKSRNEPEFSPRDEPRGLFGKPTLFFFWLFVLVACTALLIPALPQHKLLKEIEAELAETEREERALFEKSEQLKAEEMALLSNSEYLQSRARDPLRYKIEGETIIQLED